MKQDEYQVWLKGMIKSSEKKGLYTAALAYQGALVKYEMFKKEQGQKGEV